MKLSDAKYHGYPVTKHNTTRNEITAAVTSIFAASYVDSLWACHTIQRASAQEASIYEVFEEIHRMVMKKNFSLSDLALIINKYTRLLFMWYIEDIL